jgi:hypothetical protein
MQFLVCGVSEMLEKEYENEGGGMGGFYTGEFVTLTGLGVLDGDIFLGIPRP